jgi:putative transposase
LLRVALKNRVELPGEPVRPRPKVPAFPEIPEERNRIWIWDCSHFTRCKRVAYAIVDVVTRYWIGYLLTTEQTTTQVQLLFARALEDQGLLREDGLPPDHDPEDPPILVAWSDDGSEMTAVDTRQFMALMAIAQHHGRPATPTDQAHIESFFSHLKGGDRALALADQLQRPPELPRIRPRHEHHPSRGTRQHRRSGVHETGGRPTGLEVDGLRVAELDVGVDLAAQELSDRYCDVAF